MIGIAGAGRLGRALGRLLADRGETVAAVSGRRPESAEEAAQFIGGCRAVPLALLPEYASRILIATPDGAIAGVAVELARAGMGQGIALHTCGALGPEALEPLAARGVACGALHPLQTVATAEQGLADLIGVTWAIGGDAEAMSWAAGIAQLLEGRTIRIPSATRAAYHAAAAMASNYTVSLIDAAVILMRAAGVREEEALEAIGPLVRSSVRNALALGPEKALTGPIDRGDAETVDKHLRAMGGVAGSVQSLYRAAGRHTVELARRRGLSPEAARLLEEILREGWREDA